MSTITVCIITFIPSCINCTITNITRFIRKCNSFPSLKTYIIVFSTSVTGITISIHINIHIV